MATPYPYDSLAGAADVPDGRPNILELSVTELSFALKRTLEEGFSLVRVRGEIGKVSRPGSGHLYFDLKDEGACIAAVVWRTNLYRIRFKPEQGMEVVVTGRITTFPSQSKYQLSVDTLEPAGAGALMAMLEERRRKLAAEGLFDAARKVKLPFLPRVIGVITSPTGAVIRDILHRLAERFPRRVIVWPVRVQGEGSAAEVAAAIRGFNALPEAGVVPRPDLIIVARGGGSIEDLWGFNEEIAVRAAADSVIPLISAIGHETDITLLDHAADHRAPTPTAAAERAVPVRSELREMVTLLALRQRGAVVRLLEERRTRLRSAGRGLPKPQDLLALARQRLDTAAGRLGLALRANTTIHRGELARVAARLSLRPVGQMVVRHRETVARLSAQSRRSLGRSLEQRRDRLGHLTKLLVALSYPSVLARGFVLVRDSAETPVLSAGALAPGAAVTLEFHDGRKAARIGGDSPRPLRRRPGGGEGQGSLF
jgi:exodeoxyribonuclease VII large subunit